MDRVHQYTQQDFTLSLKNNGFVTSTFDNILMNLWEDAMNKGLFRYKLTKNCLPFKILPGKFKYIAQLNPERAEKRRKPQEIQSPNQPFNPDHFNFNKVHENEVLLRLKPYWSSSSGSPEEHLLLINVSPLEYCHVLLTPFRNQNRVQKVTREGLQLALELVLQSNSSEFRVGFNSLCGFASVNHEHWHAYYLTQRLYVENCPLKKICDEKACYEFEDVSFPPGFCFLLKKLQDLHKLLDELMELVNLFQEEDIAHNLYITRGDYDESVDGTTSIRVFVWAREPSFGAKGCDAFNPALCELAGHFPIKNEAAYQTLTEEGILDELHAICDKPFYKVKSWITSHV